MMFAVEMQMSASFARAFSFRVRRIAASHSRPVPPSGSRRTTLSAETSIGTPAIFDTAAMSAPSFSATVTSPCRWSAAMNMSGWKVPPPRSDERTLW